MEGGGESSSDQRSLGREGGSSRGYALTGEVQARTPLLAATAL